MAVPPGLGRAGARSARSGNRQYRRARAVQAESVGSTWLGDRFAVPQRLIAARQWSVGWVTPIALAIALAARLPFVRHSEFPPNDGGLFAAMSNELAANGLALPAVTSYNAEGIPYAYPPVAFYLNAILHLAIGIDSVTLARWLPLVENLATVLAVAVLAQLVLPNRRSAALAPIVFALLPRSYQWMIMGGGLTRSLGLLLAILCVQQAVQVARAPSVRRLALCAVFAGLAIATHLEEGLFAIYSAGLALVCFGGGVRSALLWLVVALGAALVAAPWWVAVIAQHGIGPFVFASLTSGWSTPGTLAAGLGEFVAPPSVLLGLVGALGLLGAAYCVLRGEFFVPVWLLAIFVLTPRSGPSEGVIPLAMLVSVAIVEIAMPVLARAGRETQLARLLETTAASRRHLWSAPVPQTVVAIALLVTLLATYRLSPRLPLEMYALDGLTPGDSQAMAWIAANAAPDAQFLVLSSTTSWEEDRVGEWFPMLTGRQSVLTVQGSEWLPDEEFERKKCLFMGVRDLVSQNGVGELETWAADRGVSFSDVYVSKVTQGGVDLSAILSSAEASSNYAVVLDSPEVTVLHRTEPLLPRWPDSGAPTIATDCQSLGDQTPDVIAEFQATFASRAGAAWVSEHEAELPPRPGLTSLLARTLARH